MITKERIKKAKAHLLLEAKQIEEHIAKIRNMAKDKFLFQWNGKVVNKRIFAPMARLYGCEEKTLPNGETYFPNAKFTFHYMPAPLSPGRSDVPQMQVKVCEGWGDFEIPLICEWDGSYRLKSIETIAAWEKIIELRQKWADKHKEAAARIAKSASVYNKIEKEAVKLIDFLETGPDGLEITTLCAFGGDIYKRLNAFRWPEQDPEVK